MAKRSAAYPVCSTGFRPHQIRPSLAGKALQAPDNGRHSLMGGHDAGYHNPVSQASDVAGLAVNIRSGVLRSHQSCYL